MSTYYVFSQKDKGGCYIEPMNRGEVEKALGPGGDFAGRPILGIMPDWDRDNDGIVIIKGEIVVPDVVKMVTEYKIP
jgi:hypothetical protein